MPEIITETTCLAIVLRWNEIGYKIFHFRYPEIKYVMCPEILTVLSPFQELWNNKFHHWFQKSLNGCRKQKFRWSLNYLHLRINLRGSKILIGGWGSRFCCLSNLCFLFSPLETSKIECKTQNFDRCQLFVKLGVLVLFCKSLMKFVLSLNCAKCGWQATKDFALDLLGLEVTFCQCKDRQWSGQPA